MPKIAADPYILPGGERLTRIFMAVLRIGTRGSLLAKTQSRAVATALMAANTGLTTELVSITTTGDRTPDGSLQNAGGKGLFVKELQQALREKTIDIAVHSAKDLPMGQVDALIVAATPTRADPHDVWIAHGGLKIADLPPQSVVGTTSLRRQALLLSRRPDLRVVPLRGNIDTRLEKVRRGVVAGTFLAKAGLDRTGLMPHEAITLPLDEFIPAAGQGTLALECRESDAASIAIARTIHDPVTASALAFERRVVEALAGSCLAPIGVMARPRWLDHPGTPGWIVRAFVALPDASQTARAALINEISACDADIFNLLISTLNNRGAREIMAKLSLQ